MTTDVRPVRSLPQLRVLRLLPGLLVTLGLAGIALVVAQLPVWPFTLANGTHPLEPVLLAIVLGMLLANVQPPPAIWAPGVKFASKRLLPVAIVLLGARLDLVAILKAGLLGAALSVATIAAGLGLFLLFIRLGWVKRKLGLLLGIGTAICGGTAIVAAQPIVEADDHDVAFSVASVTLVGMVMMFLLPWIGHAAGMGDVAFGIWAGLAIHQTPQVVAAGFAYSQPAGDMATIVKLARVSLLAPVLIGLSWWIARTAPASPAAPRRAVRLRSAVPLFVLGFLLMALLRTLGWLPDFPIGPVQVRTVHWCDVASKFLIVVAMAAVGLEARFSALRRTGLAPLLLAAAAAAFLATGVCAALTSLWR